MALLCLAAALDSLASGTEDPAAAVESVGRAVCAVLSSGVRPRTPSGAAVLREELLRAASAARECCGSDLLRLTYPTYWWASGAVQLFGGVVQSVADATKSIE